MTPGAMVMVSGGGHKSLSAITDFARDIEASDSYQRSGEGNHILYVSRNEDYCLKKSRVRFSDEAERESCAERLRDELERFDELERTKKTQGGRYLKINDCAVTASDAEDGNACTVFLHLEKAAPLAKRVGYKEAVRICTVLCELTEGRQHNNINHRNVFLNGNDILLGNPALAGVKNEIGYYTAPEILLGGQPTPASDVYSLGVLLYGLLRSGEENVFAVNDCYGITKEQIRLSATVPAKVAEIVLKAVSPDPGERYASPAKLKDELVKAITERKKLPWKPMVIAAAAVLLCVAAAYFGLREYDPGAKKIRRMISSGSYSLAYKEICERPKNGATDRLIEEYIDGCLKELDYRRAAEIIPEFSQEAFESPDYLKKVFDTFRAKDKMNVLGPVLSGIYSRSSAVAELIDSLGPYGR